MTETLPRRVRISRYYLLRLIGLFAFGVFVFCILVIHGCKEQKLGLSLLDHGEPAKAKVTAIDRKGDSGIIRFKFDVQGQSYEGHRQLSLNDIPRVKVGDDVDIVYLRDDPKTNWFGPGLSRDEFSTLGRDGLLLGAAILLLCGFFGVRDLWFIRKQTWLARYGTMGYATIRRTTGFAAQDGIEYDFNATDGRTITSRARLGVPTVKQIELKSVVEVFYDPQRPERNLLAFRMTAARIV